MLLALNSFKRGFVLRQKNTSKEECFNWLIQFVFDIVFTIQVFIKIINFNGFGLAYLQ
jgi:hypothetical protein